MEEHTSVKRRTVRLSVYVVFVIIAFVLSLYTIPFELFFLPSGIILMVLRTVEKELSFFPKKAK